MPFIMSEKFVSALDKDLDEFLRANYDGKAMVEMTWKEDSEDPWKGYWVISFILKQKNDEPLLTFDWNGKILPKESVSMTIPVPIRLKIVYPRKSCHPDGS